MFFETVKKLTLPVIVTILVNFCSDYNTTKAKAEEKGLNVIIELDISKSTIESIGEKEYEKQVYEQIKNLEIRSGLDTVTILVINHKGCKKKLTLKGNYNTSKLKSLISEIIKVSNDGGGVPMGTGFTCSLNQEDNSQENVFIFISDMADEKCITKTKTSCNFIGGAENLNENNLKKFVNNLKQSKTKLVAFLFVRQDFENKLNEIKKNLPPDKLFVTTLEREKLDESFGIKEVTKRIGRTSSWL